MRSGHTIWLAILAIASVLGSTLSHTQAEAPRKPALHWSRGEGASTCIDPRTLAQRVEALTGPVLVPPAESDLSIEGHVDARVQGGFRVRITVTRIRGAPVGDRVIEHEGTDCRALDGAVAFVIALTIDPSLSLEGLSAGLLDPNTDGAAPDAVLLAELTRTPPKPVAVPPALGPIVLPIRKAAPPSKPEIVSPLRHWEVGIAGLFSARELPNIAWGAVASAAYRARYWRIEAQGRGAAAPQPLRVDGVRRARTQLFGIALLGCPRRSVLTHLTIEACVGAELGFVRAQGSGFSSQNEAQLTQYAALLGPGLELPLSGAWDLHLRALARLNLKDTQLVYTEINEPREAFAFPRLTFLLTGGVSYAF